jgi:hypothetical protein
MQSVIEDRKRVVSKIVSENQIFRQIKDSEPNQDNPKTQFDDISNWTVLIAGKKLMSVLMSRISPA